MAKVKGQERGGPTAPSVISRLLTGICFWTGLTPELSRTDLRHGGVVHVTAQAEPRSGLGLNELLGWGQLLSDATMCHHANADFKLNDCQSGARLRTANVSRGKNWNKRSRARSREPGEEAKLIADAKTALAKICPGPS